MAADPIIYCLEQNTDYAALETLCVDLMERAGFAGIEPIGGTGDRGRDAVWSGRDSDNSVVFAFSARGDWERKLYEDCRRIQECGHPVAKLVFVSSRRVQGPARDRAIAKVLDCFGWPLEIYDASRIRAMLKGTQRSVLADHHSIFRPPWFDVRGGLLIDAARDTLVIDHLECDHAFATWLSRRLELVGYKVWCHGLAPLVGENAHDTVGQLIATRALRYLPVLSAQSVRNRSLLERCARADSTSGLTTLPCTPTHVDDDSLGEQLRRIEPAHFNESWSKGLDDLLRTLEATGMHPTSTSEFSRHLGSPYHQGPTVVKDEPEAVYANVFRATVPRAIAVFQLSEDVGDHEIEKARKTWAFARAPKRVLLAFETPPESVCLPLLDYTPSHYDWRWKPDKHARKSIDVVKELTRRTLGVACGRAGLEWCDDQKGYYVPQAETGLYEFRHVDGERRRVSFTGHRSYGSSWDKKQFSHQLAPRFRIDVDEERQVWMTLRLYIRLVGEDGTLVPRTSIARRRKKVTRQWWNKEWLMRKLAMMQRISQGKDVIEVGQGTEKVSVTTVPLQFECPVSIDADAMEALANFQGEFANLRGDWEDDPDGDMDGGADVP